MSDLKPCPCGKVPVNLVTISDHDKPKWAFVEGDCCGSWATEFRNDNLSFTSDESIARAKIAWNNAPRGEK